MPKNGWWSSITERPCPATSSTCSDEPELPDEETCEPKRYRPDPDDVRARMQALLGEVRAADTLPWSDSDVRYYATVFPQMANWLPDDEAAQLCFAFEIELERLKAA